MAAVAVNYAGSFWRKEHALFLCFITTTRSDEVPSTNNGVTSSSSAESSATIPSGSLLNSGTADPRIQDTPSRAKGSKRKQDGGKSTAKGKRQKLASASDAETGGEMTNYQKISKSSPAYAIIINNQKFDKENDSRNGSEKDVKSIQQLKKLNIHFEHTLTDLTADEMVGALKYLATKDPNSVTTPDNGKGALKLLNTPEEVIKSYKNIDQMIGGLKSQKSCLKSFENYSCLMVFILTHGSQGGVLMGRDFSETTVEKLAEIFNSEQCKDLKEMPKMFFIQACRGENLEMKTDQSGDQDRNNDNDDENTSFTVPKEADFLFVYATPEGYKALRDPKKGSPFIQTLVKVLLQTRQHNHHLEEALLSVKHKVAKEDFSMHGKQVKMMPSVVSQMRGKIEFDLSPP